MLPRVEYTVTVPVPVDAAFQAFQDLERLLHRGIYDKASWVEGKPWQPGSRLRYVIVQPVSATVSAVVTSISPPRAISLINHGLGVTGEQNITFGPDLKGGTRVRITMDLVGKSSELSEKALHEAIAFVIKDALDTMAALCQRRASPAPG
ncbi:MAG TPA: SRPBCC family protein [Terriglobales bacterium]|nr:SRPBCC family protein [Terriglobales bacterium]